MANSGTVTAGSAALASQYNNLRDDVLNITTGHTHTGASENGAKVAATGVSSGTAALGAVLTADGSGGASFAALAAAGADFQEFTSSGSWVKPAGRSAVYVLALGGGGGGGGGGIQQSGSSLMGAVGGQGASPVIRWMAASALPGTVTVTIGAGGAGGTALTQSTAEALFSTNGNAGGETSFGTAIVALGGRGGTSSGASKDRLTGVGIAEYGQPLAANGGSATAPGRTSDEPNLTASLVFTSENFRPGEGSEATRAAVRALTKAGGGGGGGQYNNNATGFFPGGAGARGFGHQLCAPAAGGSAAATAIAGENGGAFGLGNGGAGGGPGNAANITGGAGGNGYLGGGGGGGASAFRSSGTVTSGAGGTGGGGYMLVISV